MRRRPAGARRRGRIDARHRGTRRRAARARRQLLGRGRRSRAAGGCGAHGRRPRAARRAPRRDARPPADHGWTDVDDPRPRCAAASAAGGRASSRRGSGWRPTWSAARSRAWQRCAGCSPVPRATLLELDDGALVPLVADAVRLVDPDGRRIEVDRAFSGPADEDRRLHAVPRLVRLVQRPAPRAQRARRSGTGSTAVDMRATTPLTAGQVDDTPYGGGAGMVIRVDVVEAALARATAATRSSCRPARRVIALAAGGRQFDDALATELAAEPARDAALRALRGLRRARARAPGHATWSRSAPTCWRAASWPRWSSATP